MLGDNINRNHINKPLNLLEHDQDLGITINWTSDRPDLIDDNGEIDLIHAENNEDVQLKADMTYEDVTVTYLYQLKITKNAEDEDILRSLEGRLNDNLQLITKSDESSQLNLPGDLGDGIEVRWFKRGEQSGSFLIPILLIFVLITYFKRYDKINKEIREAKESVIMDLPGFINKLVLLLNAGLVVSAAFEKIINDYGTFNQMGRPVSGKNSYFYEQLHEIQAKVDKSNASLITELNVFSHRCGVREMVRLSCSDIG